jgi:predicted lipoprotein with Yx(FWY)xxD motif
MGVRLRWAIPAAALFAVAGVGASMAATMSASGTVKSWHSAKYGALLATAGGMTLYHYTDDRKGKIDCTGACASFWPPLTVKAGTKPTAGTGVNASKLSAVKRPDGRWQVTYNGLTLYRYKGDAKPGDAKGEGVEGSWFAVSPKGALVKAASPGGGADDTTTTTPPPATTTTDPGYGYGGY